MHRHPIVERSFPTSPDAIEPTITAENRPYWDALKAGLFVGQQCAECAAIQVPGGPHCQACGGTKLSWRALSGKGQIFSWVRFHRPYLPEFADLLPYCVASVALAEGPRLYARLEGYVDPVIGNPVQLVVERWPSGFCTAIFRPQDTV